MPKYYTIPQAFEAALMYHYCGEHRQANKLLDLIINNVVKEPKRGEVRQQGPSGG
jgi:hypothetical protein